eukprot:9258126-Pyramimonas_sp.AAC.1
MAGSSTSLCRLPAMTSPSFSHENSGSRGAAIQSAKFFSMEARASTMALSSPLMTSSQVWEGGSGIHVARSPMGSNFPSTASDHLAPMCS